MDKFLTSDNLKNIGFGGLCLLALGCFYTEQVVWGSQYKEAKVELNEWKKIAMEGLRVAKEISPARLPILSGAPTNEVSPSEVAQQLKTVEDFNSETP